MTWTSLEGGCLCGAVRYRIDAPPCEAGYCHCRLCQKASGAPALMFATVPLAAFVLTKGEPRRRASTAFGERWFCADCGSPIAMRVDYEPHTIDVTAGTLDDPSAVRPQMHICRASRIPWFEITDDLPRYNDWGSAVEV